jgi:uncharacterized protein (UPF0210 family)
MKSRITILALLWAAGLLLAAALAAAGSRPGIRAVTAFIEVDPVHYAAQIGQAQEFLANAKNALNQAGFEGAGGRITTQPFPLYTRDLKREDALVLIRKMREAAQAKGTALNIGPAMINDNDDAAPVELLSSILPEINVNANLIAADDKGIHWRSISEAAKLIKRVSERSPNGGANFNFATIAMMKPYGPYYPGSYHLGKGHAFAIAIEGANIVADVFGRYRNPVEAEQHLAEAMTKYTREVETIAMRVASTTGWTYEGIDGTPAPGGKDSIASAMELFIGGPFGSSGTLTASGIITRAVQATPVKHAGYSGLMIPVMEDAVLARRWAEGTFTLDSILAYSSVCAAGVDTVPLAGDITEQQLARILGDVAWLAYRWNKPLAARLLPAPGKRAGDSTEFPNAALTNTVVQPLSGSPRAAR